MDGFLLGLANGTVCFAYCAPAFTPYLIGTGRAIKGNYGALTMFLSGRLAGYVLFAALAWTTNRLVVQEAPRSSWLPGIAYLLLAVALGCFGWGMRLGPAPKCAAGPGRRLTSKVGAAAPWIVPGILGFLTGLNLCPPFVIALARATDYSEFSQTLLFFVAFFVGTSVFLVPLPFLGIFRGFAPWQTIGRLAALVVSVFYFYKAVIVLAGGVLV